MNKALEAVFRKYAHWFWLLALGTSFFVEEMREAIPLLVILLLGFIAKNFFALTVTIALLVLFLKKSRRNDLVVYQPHHRQLTERQLTILDYLTTNPGREIDTPGVVYAIGGNAEVVAVLADLECLTELGLITNEQDFVGRPARWDAGRNARRYLRERGLLN
ncbi:MAG: hypothetical protein JKY40_10670 [Gammaproteobacteria bacterium]|nr:hypothetical protein [Gammaproteobacteria bacterium]MBL4729749.1 hypothetical protein [Gammaproteobacteria bacterium]